MNKKFKGVFSALLTPYDQNGKVNASSLELLVDKQLSAGIMGFFVCGSSGEGLLLSYQERCLVAETVVKSVAGRIPVIVHVGHPATDESVKLAVHAAEIGADAVSSLPPLFFNFSEGNARFHYLSISRATDLPFLAYIYSSGNEGNYVSMDTEWLNKQKIPNLLGFKYTGSEIQKLKPLLDKNESELIAFTGSDELFFQGLSLGSAGGIGTNQNIIPGAFADIYNFYLQGDFKKAAALQLEVNELAMKLMKAGLISAHKYILSRQGFNAGKGRGPLVPLNADVEYELDKLREESQILAPYGLKI